MKRKNVLWMVVIAAFTITIGSTQVLAAEKVIKWKMQTFMPSTSNAYKHLQQFCDKVKKETNNRLQITLYPPKALYPDLKVFKNVKAGVVEIGHTGHMYYQGIIPEVAAILPSYGHSRWEDAYFLWYYGGQREILYPIYEKHGVFPSVMVTMGAEPIWSKVPVRSLKDFKGLKLRMTGGAGRFFKQKLGASVTLLGAAELYTALKLGTVDACEFTGGSLDYALGLHEVTKYIIMPPYMGAGLTEFLTNLKAYKKLPEDVRRIFDLCWTWAETYITFMALMDNQKAIQKMIKEGNMQVIWLPDAEVAKIRELAMDFWDEELASISPTAAKMIDIYKSRLKDVGILK